MEVEAQLFVAQARVLLEGVTRGEATIAQFERAFLDLYSDAPTSLPAAEAAALEDMFWAVESYVEDPALRDANEIDDGQLLEVAATSLAKLG